MKDTDRWEERGSPWNMLESVVCRGAAGAMLRAPRGVEEEDLQNVMDLQTGRGAARRRMHAEERCVLSEGICRTLDCHAEKPRSRSQSREGRLEEKLHVQLDTRNCFHHSRSINMLARGLWSKPEFSVYRGKHNPHAKQLSASARLRFQHAADLEEAAVVMQGGGASRRASL